MSTLSHQPAQKPPPPHAISLILSNEENENVFRALQPRCQSQATAIVEVYFTMAANPQVWSKLGVGIAAFVKDNSRRSYFIQVFDVEVCTQQTHNLPPLLMEQEIYREFIYTVSKESFHQFEGDERIIGLNFADDEEAWLFSTAVQNLLTGRQRRRDERKREAMLSQQKLMLQQQQEQQYQEKVSQHRLQQQQQQDLKEQQQSKSSKYRTIRGMKKLMDKYGNPYKEKPRRLEIGRPTDFKHISHAGLDSVFNINPDIEELLKNIGVDNQEMSEPKTQRYVMHFIENVGGMEEVRKMNRKLSTHRGGVESYRLPVSKPSSAHRLSRGFPDIEEDRSPSSSFNMPPPEAPPTLPPEYSTYRPPVPPRDTPSGTSLPNAPVPPPPRSVSHHSNHGKMLSLYSSKATPNEGHQRFPTTPSGRQLPVIQNAPGPGHSRPSQAYSKSGTPRSPHSPPIEAFSPPSPLLPRGFAPPPPSTYSNSGPAPPPRTSGGYGSSPLSPSLANGKASAVPSHFHSAKGSTPAPPSIRSVSGSVPVPPPLPSGRGSALAPPPMPVMSGSVPVPPPLPSGRGSALAPPPMPYSNEIAARPQQMAQGSGFVPPPPPPPPPLPSGTGSAPIRNNPSAPDDQRSALLQQIRGGHALKSASAAQPARKETPSDARSEMLERIRTGVTLTHVETPESKAEESDIPVKLEGWALDLHNALMKREQFIQSSDESGAEVDDDDDDWDDSD